MEKNSIMHVLYVVSSMKKSGLTKIIFNVTKNIINNGVTVSIIELNPDVSDSIYKSELMEMGILFYNADLTRYNLFSNMKLLFKYFSSLQPDIIHCHCFRSIFYTSFLANRKLRSKFVCTFHSYIPTNFLGEFGPIRGKIFSSILLNAAKRFDSIVSVSNSVKYLFDKKHKIDTFAICNGVSLTPRKTNRLSLENGITFIYTGSISNRKRVNVICDAFINAKKIDSNNRLNSLLVVGGGPKYDETLNLYCDSPFICFTGRVLDVQSLLEKSHYFVSASSSEGLPNSVMEAMALGLPCLLSDIPPHLELLRGSVSGNSFSLDSDDELSHMFIKYCTFDSNEYEIMSKNSYNKIVSQFNVDIMAENHLHFYNMLLK